MFKFLFTIYIFEYIFTYAASQDVLGCGGFIKSHVPIDFSRVEVKLLTKQGILKDKINCAPTNGYYFVPLYDKGEYVLELEPPPGWSFTPTKVAISVDGSSDLCSQGKDINFIFKGFGITGKVESLGARDGPEGVEVELKSDSEVRKAVTSSGGNFFFTPVYPGNYTVRISNTRWKVFKDSVEVTVTEGNTELPPKSLIIQGYQVTGVVKNEGQPIRDTTILLYSSEGANNIPIEGCNKDVLPGHDSKVKPVCYVKTNENGVFTFKTVPFGRYFVTPYYHGLNIYYLPSKIEFNVEHNDVKLQEEFEIVGFSMEGLVLKSQNGSPLPNAKIYFNGKPLTQSDHNGRYKLDKLKAGTFTLRAEADGFLFNDVTVKINPNTKVFPNLVPTSYRICGNIVSERPQTITFSQIGSTRIFTTLSNPNTGQFCEFLEAGKYEVQVVVSSGDAQRGLQFFPRIQTIEVSSSQMGAVTFSQLKATVYGKVKCIQDKDCIGLKALLKPLGDLPDKNGIAISVTDNSYKVDNIYPGTYEISLLGSRVCWKDQKQIVNVNSINVEVPTFIQTGYTVIFISSHDTQVTYRLPDQSTTKSIDISKGRLSYCLEFNGSYTFNLNSCHTYESSTVTYDTDAGSNEIFLNAQKHTITALIESDKKNGEVTAAVNIEGARSNTGPLPFVGNGYQLKLILSPSEEAIVVPHSDIMYFNPPIAKIKGSIDCEDQGVKFSGHVGIVFKGKVIPPLAGVSVTVEASNTDIIMAETDDKGVYKFPPLDKSKTYTIAAKKDYYVLIGPNKDGDFLAHKLAEIVIRVLDKANNAPLQGALLSLSGGESYRSNLQTDETGKITFNNLSPGEYFLRPMMKEYNFEPSSKIVTIKEGQTVDVQLMGRRVAYSAYGQVTSLNGEPEENIVVVASGLGNCSHFSEESTSESNGQFRIRGLQPYCSYDIKVKGSLNNKVQIERSAPSSIHIDKVTQDIRGLKIVIFRPAVNTDLLVKVLAKNPESYKSLRIKVVREPSIVKGFDGIERKVSGATVFTGRVDAGSTSLISDNNGILVHVPPIPLDGATYSVHLESSQNNRLEPEPQLFVANASFKYVELNLVVKNNVTEQDIKQTSVWTLVIIFCIMLAVYNIEKITILLKDRVGMSFNNVFASTTAKKPAPSDYAVDYEDIDQIVKSINAVKRKPKPKRI